MTFLKQVKLQNKKAIQELELKMKDKLNLIAKVQIALSENFKRITVGFLDYLTALKHKVDHLERSRATTSFKPEISEWLSNDLGTIHHDVNQLMKACNKIVSKTELGTTRVVDRLGKVEAHTATAPRSAQHFTSSICPQKAEKSIESLISRYNDDEPTSSDVHREELDTKYEFDKSSLKKTRIFDGTRENREKLFAQTDRRR